MARTFCTFSQISCYLIRSRLTRPEWENKLFRLPGTDRVSQMRLRLRVEHEQVLAQHNGKSVAKNASKLIVRTSALINFVQLFIFGDTLVSVGSLAKKIDVSRETSSRLSALPKPHVS